MSSGRRTPVWPVWVLALPAAVAIWAGWVGLGQMTGFGKVQLLPGIADDLVLNTAVTLPIGLEAFSAYGMYVWLASEAPKKAREFARVTSIIALVLGALGQISYHLMAAAGVQMAPWGITAAVSCVPIAVLGMAAALAHLVRSAAEEPARGSSPVAAPSVPATPPTAPLQPPVSIPPVRTGELAQTGPRVVPIRPEFTPAVRPGPVAQTGLRTVPQDVPDRSEDRQPDRPAGRPGPTVRTGPETQQGPVRNVTSDRSEPSPRTGPAKRSGPSRKPGAGRSGKQVSPRQRTDDDLLHDVRELAAGNGGEPPTKYQLKHTLGIGNDRAARLLEQLDPVPAGTPASNGAAKAGQH